MLKTQDFIELGLYKDKNAVIQDGLCHLTQMHPEIKIKLAIHPKFDR